MTEFSRYYAAGQILGDRSLQADHFAIADLSKDQHDRLLFVVTDGMGSHKGAATAARSAADEFCEHVRNCSDPLASQLSSALDSANAVLAKAAIRDPAMEGAGCTLLAAAIENRILSWISVGDTSLYLIRNGELRKLNDDHSMRPVFSKMVADGRMRAKTAARNPRRHILCSALTGADIQLINSCRQPLELIPGDRVLLASDGLEALGNRCLVKVLKRAAKVPPSAVVELLLKETQAAKTNNRDNTTVIFFSGNTIRSGWKPVGGAQHRSLFKFWPAVLVAAILVLVTALSYSGLVPWPR